MALSPFIFRTVGAPFRRSLATMIEGRAVAQKILEESRQEIDILASRGVKPTIVPVVVGNVAESEIYVNRKKAAAAAAGLGCWVLNLQEGVDQVSLLERVRELNSNPEVHGVIIQLPLPAHLDEETVCNAVDVEKDVDGFTRSSLGSLVHKVDGVGFVPCTPLAVLNILKNSVKMEFKGGNAVVAGRSHNVGLPIAMILQADGAKGGLDLTTTICHRYTPGEQLSEAVSKADVVVSAAGVPGLITKDMVKPGACVVDVGINRIVDPKTGKQKVVGDVSPDVAEVAGWMTPVPGGVGPCTVACLLYNTVLAAKRQTI